MFRRLAALAVLLPLVSPALGQELDYSKPIAVETREGTLVPFTAISGDYFKELHCEATPLQVPYTAQVTCAAPAYRILTYFTLQTPAHFVITEIVVDGPQLSTEQMLAHVNEAISGMSFDGPEPDDY